MCRLDGSTPARSTTSTSACSVSYMFSGGRHGCSSNTTNGWRSAITRIACVWLLTQCSFDHQHAYRSSQIPSTSGELGGEPRAAEFCLQASNVGLKRDHVAAHPQ